MRGPTRSATTGFGRRRATGRAPGCHAGSQTSSCSRNSNSEHKIGLPEELMMMKLRRRQFLYAAASVAVLPALSSIGWAQTYPMRPVRIIVAATPGSAPDILTRLIGQWLSERLGQPFIIENRPGAGGNIGTEAAVRGAP